MQLPLGSLAAAGVALAEGISSHMLSLVNIWRYNMSKLFTALILAKKGGGIQWTYRACMTGHGEQP